MLLAGVIGAIIVSAHAETLVVATGEHCRWNEFSVEQIRDLYEAKRFRVGNERVVLLNLEAEHPLRKQFEQEILRENRENLSSAWLGAHYDGHPPPKVFKTPHAAAEFLNRVENAVGYLDESTARRYRLKILYSGGE